MDLGFRMHAERTPNPNSIKWVLGRPVVDASHSANFAEQPTEGVSPLAHRLFSLPEVTGVFMASNFVTVTKNDETEWPDVAQSIVDVLKECLGEGGSALGPDFEASAGSDDSEIVTRIRAVLDREIRPAVARDGGDIVFAGFRGGVVELYMQGSCAGCPSSTATLKHGIEARLRDEFPEVESVAAI